MKFNAFRRKWLTSYMNLWYMEKGKPVYIPFCKVDRIIFGEGMNDAGPGRFTSGGATVTVSAPLPWASWLFSLPSNTGFEIHYREWGPRDEYDSKNALLKLTHCQRADMRMEDVVVQSPEDSAALTLSVTLQCAVELVLDEAYPVRP